MKLYKDDDGIILTYDSLEEYHERTLKEPLPNRDNSSITGRYEFTGTHSYEEAHKLMRLGDKESFKKIQKTKIEVDKYFKELGGKKIVYENSVVGYQPNVPNYLMGLPNSMIDVKHSSKKIKVLNIFITMSANSMKKASDIRYFGVFMLSVVDSLEREGYRVNLYTGSIGTDDNMRMISTFMRLKKAEEPLNTYKLAFYIANPSYLRRTEFRVLEVESDLPNVTHDGYRSISEGRAEKICNFIKDNMNMDLITFHYWNGPNVKNSFKENIEIVNNILKGDK